MRQPLPSPVIPMILALLFLPLTSIGLQSDFAVGNVHGAEPARTTVGQPQDWNVELLDEVDAPGSIRRISVRGDRAALSLIDGSLAVVDVTDPTRMVLGQTLDFGNPNPLPVAAGVDIAVAVYDDLGLWIMDWTDPDDVQVVGSHAPPYRLEHVALQGDLAYVAAFDFGLLIYDISDRTSPTIVGSWAIDQSYDPQVLGVFVDGDIVLLNWGFWSSWDYNFYYNTHVLDVSDVTAPVHTAEIYGTRFGAFRDGLFATSRAIPGGCELRIITLADIGNPETIGVIAYDHDFRIIWCFDGPYLYAGDSSSQVAVADLSDPTAPVHQAVAMLPHGYDPGVVEGALYVAQWSTFRSYAPYAEEPVMVEDTSSGDPHTPDSGWNLTCYPNPFNPRTTIAFEVPVSSQAKIRVFDARGREVAVIFDGPVDAGLLEVCWTGHDRRGRSVPSGTYFVKAHTAGRDLILPLTLIR